MLNPPVREGEAGEEPVRVLRPAEPGNESRENISAFFDLQSPDIS